MGATPWGKIELGLPKWHAKQRDQEESRINKNLSSPYVEFVPLTRIGTDVHIQELLEMGFSAVLLAIGAWKDRPLAIPGIDAYQGRGFYYQNPYVSWFNQSHDPEYSGPQMEIVDGAMVVGGGLASLDVVKILMLESTLRALRKRGLPADLFTLEKKGIPKVLASFGLSWEELGLKGCTLFYRRRAQDMPLIPMEDTSTPERQLQAEKVRQKLLDNFLSKYMCHFKPCHLPIDKIIEGERLAGLRFLRTEVLDGKVIPLPGSDIEVRSPLVISSIGSLPEAVPGLGTDRELLQIEDSVTGRLEGFQNVFALGNAVTGRGNIRASRIHGRQVAEWVMDSFLKWSQEDAAAAPLATRNKNSLLCDPGVKSEAEIQSILKGIRRLQKRVGYDGDFDAWVERHRPVRLEEI
jgi:NADPH-dependent glutamate synthase beta subunit-like oxidoreductase